MCIACACAFSFFIASFHHFFITLGRQMLLWGGKSCSGEANLLWGGKLALGKKICSGKLNVAQSCSGEAICFG
ncbi:MAG TPA: hypothetical protein PKM32_02875, partial [Planctomycetota bacterium]|nr:hypothetical protein [Planctomycetota bacterium]